MRATRALEEFVIEGVKTTIPLHKKLLNNRDFRQLNFDNHWLEHYLSSEPNPDDEIVPEQEKSEEE
jgi:acetyl-CoA carboxylase biotin carboxylase subunit